MTFKNDCLQQNQTAMHSTASAQAEASTRHFDIAVNLAAIAREIDWNHDISNKTAHVGTLHALAREIAGNKAEELYPHDEE